MTTQLKKVYKPINADDCFSSLYQYSEMNGDDSTKNDNLINYYVAYIATHCKTEYDVLKYWNKQYYT